MPSEVNVYIDHAAMARLFRDPRGPIMRDLEKRARRVEALARQGAPGRMGRKVDMTMHEDHARIESTHPATGYVIRGTAPHIIRPVRRSALKFTVRGTTVFARVVHHPGTRPNDFLSKALREGL